MKRALYEVNIDRHFFDDERYAESYFVGRAKTKKDALEMAKNFIIATIEENNQDWKGYDFDINGAVGATDSYATSIVLV